jgi:ClpP class serine protease
MSISEIIWLVIILSAFQPVIQQQVLQFQRMRKIAAIEELRKSRVILLVHRQETMRFLGFPLVRYIDINDSEEVLRVIQMTDPEIPIDFILHTPGGLVLAALQIASALRGRKAKVTVFVPHYAMSGGTLIALSAGEIVMADYAVLGPVDPQLGEYPAASLIKAVEQKPLARVEDKTLILADVGRKAISQVKDSTEEFLLHQLQPEEARLVAEKLATGTWTHDYPILPREAKKLGLAVSTAMPTEVLELLRLYPQPVRSQPGGVEYLPVPRQKEAQARAAK